jgi:dTDP-4-dehydrorhamnose reductase
VFVSGWDGLLGATLLPRLREGHEVQGFGIRDSDVCDRVYIQDRVASFRPEVVLHLAAYTAVDRCEAEPEEAFRVNEEGSRTVALAAESVGALVIAISTDFVFDGESDRPYREEDPTGPLSVYGRSKLAGEQAVAASASRWAVVRSAWLYGAGGPNFVETILRLLSERETLSVVADQVGSPTHTEDLARALVILAQGGGHGVYHVVNRGQASWCDLAREAARLAGLDPARILPATTGEIGRPAPRPRYSVLDSHRVQREFGLEFPTWEEALQQYMRGRIARAGDNA